MTAQSQRYTSRPAAHNAALTAGDLRLHYYTVGADLEVFELDAYLHGMYPLPVEERNLIARALNEQIDDPPQRRKQRTKALRKTNRTRPWRPEADRPAGSRRYSRELQ